MPADITVQVLIVGASGVFGSRLAGLLAGESNIELTVGGRRRAPLEQLAGKLPGAAVKVLDRDSLNPCDLAEFDLVIDCAGPFQGSHSHLIEACIEARANYVDLADGREFVTSVDRFDAGAKAAGVAVISGASSIPALSHAVIDSLTAGWREIDTLRIGIFPGNRAPRGRSVVEAILSYAGKSVRVFKHGAWQEHPGWALEGRLDCGAAGRRWASVCDTPEQDLLVHRYAPTNSAEFVAGLELPVLHLGLWLLSLPVRIGWVKSLRPASRVLLWLAQQLQRFGSDRGAMVVEATGTDAAGAPATARWSLDATANLGPFVPVLPAFALVRRLAGGWQPQHGAYPCCGILERSELEHLLDVLGIAHTADVELSTDHQPARAAA